MVWRLNRWRISGAVIASVVPGAMVLFFTSCSGPGCADVDSKFASTFERHLMTIKMSRYRSEGPLQPLTDAYVYMNAVTGMEARINDFDTPFYSGNDVFLEDIRKWEDWFRKNKCSLRYEQADSLYQMYAFGRVMGER